MPHASLFLLIWTLMTLGDSPQAAGAPESAAIMKLLQEQAAAWNRHDLASFMKGYWNSPSLTFFSDATIYSGWDAALERYRRRYQSEGREMGRLAFSELRVEMLSPDSAFVRGAWQLTMPDGKIPHGIFTLVFRKFSGGWKIVHDHTSSAQG